MKRQGNIISAVMENFDIAQDVLNSSLESSGSAMKEYDTYLGSIEAKTNQFKAAFESLSTTVINSDFLKAIIGTGTNAIKVLDGVFQAFGGVGNALLNISSIIVLLNLESTLSLVDKIKAKISNSSSITKLKTGINGLHEVLVKARSSGLSFSQTLGEIGKKLIGGTKPVNIATASVLSAVAVITTAIAVYKHYKQKIEEARQAAEQAANSHNELASSTDEYKKRVSELRREIDSGNLSEEEAYNKRKELISIQNELIEKFGQEAKGINLVTGNIEAQADAIDNLLKKDWDIKVAENRNAINNAVELFTDYDSNGRMTAQLPYKSELTKAINDKNLNIDVSDFYKALRKEITKSGLSEKLDIVFGEENISFKADSIYEAQDAYLKLQEIINDVKKDFLGNGYEQYFEKSVNGLSNSIKKVSNDVKDNEEIFKLYADGALKYSDEYKEIWDTISKTQQEYEDAILSNDEEQILKSINQMKAIKDSFLSSDNFNNDAANLFITNLFNQFEEQTRGKELNLELKFKLKDSNDGIRKSIIDAVNTLKNDDTTLDLSKILNLQAVVDGAGKINDRNAILTNEEQAYITLKSAADEYEMSIEDLYDMLVDLGIVHKSVNDIGYRVKYGYDQLKASVDASVKSYSIMQDIFANNTFLSDEAYESLVALAGGETNLSECIDNTNGHLVTNAEALNNLVNESNNALYANVKLAESHEMMNYHELVSQLYELCEGTDNYTDEVIQNIDSIINQIDSIDIQIAKYKLLEQEILGVTNSFTKMNDAKEFDDYSDYTDDLSSMIGDLINSYENKEFGTEAFSTAFDALIPDDVYSKFLDAGDQIDSGWEYINNKLSRYFSYDNGSVSIDYDNIKTFIADALSTKFDEKSTVFTGSLEDFDLNPQIKSLEELASAMGITTESAFALGNAISKYTVDNDDFLSKLTPDTLESQIYYADQALEELLIKREQLIKSDKIGTSEWKELTSEISNANGEMDALRNKARENIKANIEIDDEISGKQAEVDSLQKKLDKLDESNPKYSSTFENYAEASTELAQLLQQKYELGEPTELTLNVALESVDSEINDIEKRLNEISTKDATANIYVSSDPNNQKEVDNLVGKLNKLKEEKHSIEIYMGIDKNSVMEDLNRVENMEIHDKKFKLIINGYKKVKKQLDDYVKKLDEVKSKTITITERHNIITTGSSKSAMLSAGSARRRSNGDGPGHATGILGTEKYEHNALVGELGRELYVDPNTGKYQTVGDRGAELIDLPKGSIIFNHEQTEELLKNGKINSRGIAFLHGNAYLGLNDKNYTYGSTSSTKSSSSSSSKSSSSTKSSNSTKSSSNSSSKSNSSSSSKSSTENAQTEFERLYKYHQHLLNMDQESVSAYIKWLDGAYKAAYKNGQIELDDYYNYQEEVFDKTKSILDDLRKSYENALSIDKISLDRAIETANLNDVTKYTNKVIAHYKNMQSEVHNQAQYYRSLGYSETSDELSNLGKLWWEYYDEINNAIQATYEKSLSVNDVLVRRNTLLLNQAIESANAYDISKYTDEIINQYKQMQDTVHEQAEYYRSLGYDETSEELIKLGELWWEYYDEIKNVSTQAWQQVVDNANDALDHVTDLYDTLKNAAQKYSESGYITIDILQDIYKLGVENLAYLQDENGQLVINEKNIQKVIAAKTQQMAIETSLGYIQELRIASSNNDTIALLNLTTATEKAASSTWDLVYAQLKLLGLNDIQYKNALQRINTLRSLADSVIVSIDSFDISSLNDLISYVEDMIKQEIDNQISALDDQVSKYREIVNLQKESLNIEREKDRYTKSVSEKTKSIAELQAKIAQLDLDDSREAQAEKKKLQEQLAKEQEDLAETQADRAYESTNNMLDKMAEDYEKEKQGEIETLQNSISSAEKIYQLAIERISNNWDTLYDDLLEEQPTPFVQKCA